MFELVTFEGPVRVSPEDIAIAKEEAVRKSLSREYENKVFHDVGVILVITRAWDVRGGTIEAEDPGVHYTAKFEALTFVPKIHELVIGQVVDITDFGVFVRIGPIDGMCHISQVVNDFVSYDKKSGVLNTKQSGRMLKVGDVVKARIVGVSLEKRDVNKINLTMRQPGLGSLEWLKAEKESKNKANAPKAENLKKNKSSKKGG